MRKKILLTDVRVTKKNNNIPIGGNLGVSARKTWEMVEYILYR